MPVTHLDRFLLLEPLARGGMGQVWRGRHSQNHMPVAIKVLNLPHAGDRSLLQLFHHEVRYMAMLDHPNITRIFDAGVISPSTAQRCGDGFSAGQPYLVMELATGGRLRHTTLTGGWRELRKVLVELLSALGHAHARGITHLDLKAENVLVSGPGDLRPGLKLTDFGIARWLGWHAHGDPGEHPLEGRFAGTPSMMAPEQFNGSWRTLGPWTDLYALGCLAYALICGNPPFPTRDPYQAREAHRHQPPPPLSPRFTVPASLETWIKRLLEKAPADRFQCAADAREALLALSPSRPRSRPRPALTPLPPKDPMPTSAAMFPLRPLPFVGRHQERQLLWDILGETLDTGQARLVIIEGPSGTGKSYLAHWLTEQALEQVGAAVLTAHHSASDTPSDGLVPMGLEHFRAHGLSQDHIRLQVEQELLRLGIEDGAEVEAITQFLMPSQEPPLGGVPSPVEPEVTVRLLSMKERHTVLRRYLTLLAGERPVILWLDDVHWGSYSLQFAQSLLEAQAHAPAPILVLATAQHEALPERAWEARLIDALAQSPLATHLPLTPMTREAHRALVGRALGLAPPLAEQIAEATRGNPLFAVQLVGSWFEADTIHPSPEGLILRHGATLRLPDSLQQVWQARLARVLAGQPAGSQDALELIAIAGQEVVLSEWAALCAYVGLPSPRALLDTLLHHRLLRAPDRQWSFHPRPDRWVFVHGMLRLAIEAQAKEGQRWKAHHLCLARFLQQGHRDPTPQLQRRIGWHLFHAERYQEALEPLLRAARGLFDRTNPIECERVLRLHANALSKLDLPADDPRRGEGWLARGHTQALRGQFDEAEQSLRRLERAARGNGWPALLAEALLLQSKVAHVRDDRRRARTTVAAALAQFKALGDPGKVAECLRQQGTQARARGDLRTARALLREALHHATTRHEPVNQAWCLTQLGVVEARSREVGAARRLYRQAYGLHRAAGHQRGMASCLINLAELHLPEAPDQAVPLFEAAIALCERSDDIPGRARALNNLGEAHRLLKRPESAAAVYREAIRLYEATGTPRAGATRINLALVSLDLGDAHVAEALLIQALPELQQLGELQSFPAYYAAMLYCAAARGNWAAMDALIPMLQDSIERAPLEVQDRWPLQRTLRLTQRAEQQGRAATLSSLIRDVALADS